MKMLMVRRGMWATTYAVFAPARVFAPPVAARGFWGSVGAVVAKVTRSFQDLMPASESVLAPSVSDDIKAVKSQSVMLFTVGHEPVVVKDERESEKIEEDGYVEETGAALSLPPLTMEVEPHQCATPEDRLPKMAEGSDGMGQLRQGEGEKLMMLE